MSQFSKYFLITTIVLLTSSFATAQLFNRAWEIPSPVGEEGGYGNVVSGMDFDGDGKVEIYAVNNNKSDRTNELIPKIYKYEFNSGTNEWEEVWTATLDIPYQNTWPALTYGDWDGDGKSEVIWGPVNFTDPPNANPSRIVVFESAGDGSDVMGVPDGSGGYLPNAEWTITATDNFNLRPIKWQLVDIDNDGDLELVYASRVTAAGPGNRYGVVSVSDIPDNGDGSETWTLEASDEANVIGAGTIYDMTVMDSTLYLFHDGGNVTPVTYSGGVWTVEPVLPALAGGGSWWSATTVDIDGDATEEIVVASWSSTNQKVYLLQGSGATLTATEIADLAPLIGSAGRIYGTNVGDLDNDGNMDFVFGSRGATPSAAITRLEYQGGDIASSGSYTSKLMDANYAAIGRWMHINVTDLDGDGNDEVIYGEGYDYPAPLVILKGGAGAVTFKVDMGVQVFKGLFDPLTQKVVIRGDFQVDAGDTVNWAYDYFEMADADGDTIYTLTVLFPDSTEGKSYEHKFVIDPDGWEGAPNRPFTVAAPNVILPTVWFGNDSSYILPVTNTIVFTADISGILGSGVGFFDPTTDSLQVMGLDWDGGTNVVGNRTMINENFLEPGEFTTTLTVTSTGSEGDSTSWKFKAYPDERFNNTGWETSDNKWFVFQGDGATVTLPIIVPDITCAAGPITSDIDVKFIVDMTDAANAYNGLPIPLDQLTFVGIKGELAVLGAWAGVWTVADINDGTMLEMANEGGNLWSITVTVPSGTPGGLKDYKFGAMYPGADTVNAGSNYLDNEAGFAQNHSFLLEDVVGNYIETSVNWATLVTGVKRIDDMTPTAYQLEQNYPNPFNPSTTIRYDLPEAGFVNLRVYNSLGEEVAVLVNQEQISGVYEVSFDASKLASGIYFYRINSGKFVTAKKMMLIK